MFPEGYSTFPAAMAAGDAPCPCSPAYQVIASVGRNHDKKTASPPPWNRRHLLAVRPGRLQGHQPHDDPTTPETPETPTKSSEARLSSLSLSVGSLSPKFSPSTLGYSTNVPNGTASLSVTAVTTSSAAKAVVSGASSLSTGDNTATVKVTAEDGTTTMTYTITVKVAAANASNVATDSKASITTGATVLAEGSNTVTVDVTAEDGTTKQTYTITVTRALSSDALLSGIALSSGSLDPAFSNIGANYAYKATVANSVSSITVTGTARHPGATVSDNGSYDLVAGTPKTVTLVVTAADGKATATYTINVLRAAAAASTDATLASLSVTDLASAELVAAKFAPATTDYSAKVAYREVNYVTIKAIPANGAVAVCRQSGSNQAFACKNVDRLLDVGTNSFTITVTAEDGVTTKTYTVTVTLSEAPTTITVASPVAGGNVACGPTSTVSGRWTGAAPAKIEVQLGTGSVTASAVAHLDAGSKTWTASMDTRALSNNDSLILAVQARNASNTVIYKKWLTVGPSGSSVNGFTLNGSIAFGGTVPTTGTLGVRVMESDGTNYVKEVALSSSLDYTICGPVGGSYTVSAIYSPTPGLDFLGAYYQEMIKEAKSARVPDVVVTGDTTIPTITID